MILAIDPSLRNTAVVRGDECGNYDIHCFGSDNHGDSVYRRVQRYRAMVGGMRSWIGGVEVAAVFIEGYSFASDVSRARYGAEFGGLLRAMLVGLTSDVYEIAPHALKKFAGGVGKGGKHHVIQGIQRRYHTAFNTDDEYDAFGLYRLGLCVLGHAEPEGRAQLEVVETIQNPQPKKRKSRKTGKRKPKSPSLFCPQQGI